jgi:pyridoxal phosphate enzyme (YggS family)
VLTGAGVSGRLAEVNRRITAAGADPATIAIVAVSKGRSLDLCREALAAGVAALGENRVQEALPKVEALPDAEWHLVGHLQSNKARQVAGRFSLIHSVDSVRLAEALAERGGARVLLEVNVARDEQKHGVQPEAALEQAAAVAGLLDLRGLMAMGPLRGDPRPCFEELRRLRDHAEQRLGRALPVLSMGMSEDFEAAVAAGSTMLRLGRVLFEPAFRFP